ncbi:hypothetical protein J2W32_006522 [Variovorax boronicumulans]|uniref:Zeta toxin domain-containing protein n=1 Tax=Variovorax boronicumulans TaxID=436515 RepID=A0AAW8D9U1_9BURK|nr:zeta toxin family protein [Variovorax boronicumulans]MDP9897413.1 hypothetical protein [Variovorax boronicumulans]MDQ0057445.1 hypothetical protein [Variovorax boronicumulans]
MEKIQRKEFTQPDRAAVQDELIRAIEVDPEPFLAAYAADPNNHGGRYVSADAFKDTFEAFRQSPEARNRYNTPVHNSAAVLASEQFKRALRDGSDPNRDAALFLTGIPGAGKTSVVMGAGFPEHARVLFEGQMHRPEPAFEKIQAALDAGLTPVVIAVHVTPEVALRRTFQRFEEYGRGASIELMGAIQAGLPEGLRKIHEKFGDSVALTVLDNRHPGHHKDLNGWQHLKQLSQEGNHERISQRLRAELERHREEGRISDACYRQANGDAPLDPSQVLAAKGHRGDQRDDNQRTDSAGRGQAAQLSGHDSDTPRPPRAVAFATLSETEALTKHPELMGAFRELAAAREKAATQHPRDPQIQAQELAASRSDIQRRLDDGRIPPLPTLARPAAERPRER